MDIKVHPAAEIFPLMDELSYQRLKADIEANGLQEPVMLWRQQLVDGRNRLRACDELGIHHNPAELEDDDDPVAFVLSANLHRRQLRTSQKAMCAARMATLSNGEHGKSSANWQSFTVEQLGEMFVVSPRAIERAKAVISGGCAELIALCESGRSVATACKFIDACESKREQSKIAREGWDAIRAHLAPPQAESVESPTPSVELPEKADASVVAEVDTWLQRQDERPYFERFRSLWTAADATGRAAIRAFVLECE